MLFRTIILFILFSFSSIAHSEEWWVGNVLFSNMCSNSYGWWLYPRSWAMPVGSRCRLPDGSPGIVGG